INHLPFLHLFLHLLLSLLLDRLDCSSKLSYFLEYYLVFICPSLGLLFGSLVLFSVLLTVQGCLVYLVYLADLLLVSLVTLVVAFCNCQDLCVLLCNYLMFFANYTSVLLNISLADVSLLSLFLTSLLVVTCNLISVLLPYCLYK